MVTMMEDTYTRKPYDYEKQRIPLESDNARCLVIPCNGYNVVLSETRTGRLKTHMRPAGEITLSELIAIIAGDDMGAYDINYLGQKRLGRKHSAPIVYKFSVYEF